jgi:hypothetical protein
MQRLTRGLGALLSTAMVFGGGTLFAGDDIRCGDTLGPGGVFTLPADLVCDAIDIALTVRDGALLDLGGHTVSAWSTAVQLDGQGAVLQSGIVVSGGVAIRIAGHGWHTVRGIVTTPGSQDEGIVVVSDHNRLISNMSSSVTTGFRVQGNNNLLARNTGFGQGAFQVDGHQNLLVHNLSSTTDVFVGFRISGNQNLLVSNEGRGGEDGVEVMGDGNRLVGNSVTHFLDGIIVSGQNNVIVGNTALENATDLVDTHETCDGNMWQQNVFQTSQAGDTANPTCIQ